MVKDRILGLDVVRTFASFFTIAGHFFSLNTHFHDTIFDGSLSMVLQSMGNFIFKGTPFFMMLSGYLLCKKIFDKQYYKRGVKVIIAYLFFSIITILFRIYYNNEILDTKDWLFKVLDYSAIPYGWYIEMWIGLFLISPFLNIMYTGSTTKKKKQILIFVTLFSTSLPMFTNRYGLSILPEYWKICYPIAYYFIGAYIHEYQPRIPFFKGLIIVISISLINPIFNILFIKNHDLVQITGDPYGIFGVFTSYLIFIMFYKIDTNSIILKNVFAKMAKFTLAIYLCCYIFDRIYYPYFIDKYFVTQAQFGKYFFIIVPLVFVSSFVVAQLKEWIFKITHLNRL